MADESTYEGWAILELMGHRRLAGYVQEVELAGHGMLRLDIPEHEAPAEDSDLHDGAPTDVKATQFYSPAALYCLTPTTEAIARAVSRPPTPAHRWELPAPPPRDVNEEALDALEEDLDEQDREERGDIPF